MIYFAQKLLQKNVLALREYASGHADAASFWRDIRGLELEGLQQLGLNKDGAFFAEIDSVLNVITTIIIHPHIVNERETVIIRAEQAYGLTPDMFIDTVHDQKLWKDKRGVMTPQEVYYRQNCDELNNYENRFIVHLLDKIGTQIGEYQAFYDYMLRKSAQDSSLVEVGSQMEALVVKLERVAKKLRRIKNTFFYREVSKANTSFVRVEATNVLKHNRAYNQCFRFYMRNITYGEEKAQAVDLANYYFTRLISAFEICGFTHAGGAEPVPCQNGSIVHPVHLQSADFTADVSPAPQFDGIWVDISHRACGNIISHNLLLLDGTVGFDGVRRLLPSLPKDAAVDAVSVWDLAAVEPNGVKVINLGSPDETQLLVEYIKDKTRLYTASKAIYQTHCPVCGGRDVTAGGDVIRCNACRSAYCFAGDKLWLTVFKRL